MRLHFADPSTADPAANDIAFVQIFECNTDANTDAGTMVAEQPFVEGQPYVDYSSPVEGKFYRIKFKDTGNKVSPQPSAPQKFSTAVDPTCLVYDTVIDLQNVPKPDAKVSVVLNRPDARFNGRSITQNDMSVMTDSAGNWDARLIPNSLITPAGTKYVFTIDGKTFERVVPNETTKRFTDLRNT